MRFETADNQMSNLILYKSMSYNILDHVAPRCLISERVQNASKSSSFRPQKTYVNPSFRCISLYLAHTSAIMNFNLKTSLGGFCGKLAVSFTEMKWPFHSQIKALSHNKKRDFAHTCVCWFEERTRVPSRNMHVQTPRGCKFMVILSNLCYFRTFLPFVT